MDLVSHSVWDEGWENVSLPITKSLNDPVLNGIDSLIKDSLKPGFKFMELGCAPGCHLIYYKKKYELDVYGIEYSKVGLGKTRENLELERVEASLFENDIFNEKLEAGLYDIVFSAGLVEHFDEPEKVVLRHLGFARSGGFIVFTVPNPNNIVQNFHSGEEEVEIEHSEIDLGEIKKIVSRLDIETIYCDYYGAVNPGTVVNWGAQKSIIMKTLHKILRTIYHKVSYILPEKNKKTSPLILCILKKH